MRERVVVTAEELATRAHEVLPECVLREAMGDAGKTNADRLERHFRYLTNVPAFGERLLCIAGLALDALYVDAALAETPGFRRDDVFDDILRQILFDRGPDLGLTCATVQRIGLLEDGPVADLVRDDRPITSFVLARPTMVGDFFRAQLRNPHENQLLDLIDHLRFLSEFRFTLAGGVFFRDVAVECRPFLRWDGRHLWRLRRLEHGGNRIAWRRGDAESEVTDLLPADGLLTERLRRIAKLIHVPRSVFDGDISVESESLPTSVLPLFADRYPEMTRLARQIWLKADEDTKYRLWAFNRASTHEERVALAQNEIFVTNEIIRQCVEKDPVTVLEQYLRREQGDQREYLEWLIPDPSEVRRVYGEIQADTSRYRDKLAAFYCQSGDLELDNKVSAYQARKAAITIVRLLGFPVVAEAEIEDVEDFKRRLAAFRKYLFENRQTNLEADPTAHNGLQKCSNTFERLLKTVVLFYEALKLFELEHVNGIGEEGAVHLSSLRKNVSRLGLGQLIGAFESLGKKDRELALKLREVAGRDSLWPGDSHSEHMKTLWRLVNWRNPAVHDSPTPVAVDPISLTESLLRALDWLISPVGLDVPRGWMIYPAHLSLNLVTQNSCGISSVRYSLVQRDTRREITLYTEQKLAIEGGSLLGLPHLGRAQDTLWVNPVLIPASLVGP